MEIELIAMCEAHGKKTNTNTDGDSFRISKRLLTPTYSGTHTVKEYSLIKVSFS